MALIMMIITLQLILGVGDIYYYYKEEQDSFVYVGWSRKREENNG